MMPTFHDQLNPLKQAIVPAELATPSHHLVSGKLNLLQGGGQVALGSEGGFGLLADVAIAAAEAEQRQQEQQEEQQQSAAQQPIDLSKK